MLCTFLATDLIEFGQHELQAWPGVAAEEEAPVRETPPQPGENVDNCTAVRMMSGCKRCNRIKDKTRVSVRPRAGVTCLKGLHETGELDMVPPPGSWPNRGSLAVAALA